MTNKYEDLTSSVLPFNTELKKRLWH